MSYTHRWQNPTWLEMIVAFVVYITIPIWVWPFMICSVFYVLVVDWINPKKWRINYIDAIIMVQKRWPFKEKEERIIR
jgi:hypothetical protein